MNTVGILTSEQLIQFLNLCNLQNAKRLMPPESLVIFTLNGSGGKTGMLNVPPEEKLLFRIPLIVI